MVNNILRLLTVLSKKTKSIILSNTVREQMTQKLTCLIKFCPFPPLFFRWRVIVYFELWMVQSGYLVVWTSQF